MYKKIALLLAAIAALWYPATTLAFMSSTNFQIISDTIGLGGGISSSTSYLVNGTLSSTAVGIVSSTSYRVMGGFQSTDSGSISLSISSASLDLGTLSTSQVNSAATVATVSTDAATGYTLSIGSVAGTSLTAVADGSVTAGSPEYGLTTSGSQSLVTTDVAVTAGLQLASHSASITNSATTLTFKASKAAATTAATYSQTVTLSAATNP
jgi:hypothetical protein